MAKVAQTAIPMPVISFVAHNFCSHIGRLAQSDRTPSTINDISKRGKKVIADVMKK